MNPLDEYNVIRRMINIVPLVQISRSHGSGEFGAMLPWQLTSKQQDLYRYYLKLRYRLHPYVYSGAIEAHLTGRPPLAALVFDYQDDPKTYGMDYEFMLGRQILVAPVLEKVDKWEVYLPKGKWVHYWTGKEYEGGQMATVDAPLYGKDGLPMFVKAGAIIPMMPEMSYIYERKAEPITLDIYPDESKPSSYVMYDCETVRGPFKKTSFKCVEAKKTIQISISPATVAYELWVHCDQEPAMVAVDGQVLGKVKNKSAYGAVTEGWYYGAGCFYGSDTVRTVNIKIPKSSTSRVIQITK
jgi:alpha-glucosidase (family GH31 glycosyl hydrolase)